jgi:hypothetical protein
LKRAEENPPKTSLQVRIEEIKFLLEGELIGEYREDVTAVLEGYESGSLEYIPWHYYVFKERKKVAGVTAQPLGSILESQTAAPGTKD